MSTAERGIVVLGIAAIIAGIVAIAGTGFWAGHRVSKITGQAIPESVASRTFNDVQIIHFLMEHNAINWAQQACYHFLVNTSLGTYCDGSALKSNDGGVSATRLCNMAGYQNAEILGTRNWKSCYDNTVIAWNGSAWVTQNACDIGNVFVYPGVRCTKPLPQPPPSPAATPTPSDDAECQERFAIRVEASSPVVGPGEPPDSANSVLGAPDGGSADFDNEGNQPGYVTVSFSAPITDGPGDDILLHHEDFSTTSQAGGPESEPFTLYGSTDGTTFVALGSRQPAGPAVGKSSVLGFDIAGRLPSVRYVKVQNDTVVFEHPFEGPEIDAFEAAHLENCQPPGVTPTISTSSCPANNGFATYLQSHTKADNPFSRTIPVAGNPAAVLGVANAVGGIENGTVPNDIEDFDNEGDVAGHATVGFGADIKGQVKIYFKDFNLSENEAFNVLASTDGINFTLIGSAVPTETAPHRLESRTFDMAAAGVESAKYIRVQNVVINNTPVTHLDTSGANEGVDLDAIQALDCVVGTSKFQCEDGVDNDGDKVVDAADPGCHSDRNPDNPATYQPTDDDESDSATDAILTPTPIFDPGGVREID